MSKRTTTRWYIGTWVVYVLAVIAFLMVAHGARGSSSPPLGVFLAYGVMSVTGIVMLMMWIGALVRLGMQQAWGWFTAVLILHLIALGIIGMVAYAIAGPEDDIVVIRPRAAS